MEVVVSAADSDASRVAKLTAENADLRQQIATLSQQLAWLQRQVFGQKSERRLIDNPDQLGLEALLGDATAAAPIVVRPAWARSWRWKSSRELTTANEAKRNCVRATERGEEAWSETASRWTRTG